MLEHDSDKPRKSRLVRVLAIAAVAAVVASMAIVGTVAAQPGQRFGDVPRDHYAYDAVNWAVDNKITLGCGDGRNFCPEQTLNRAHMVTFLKRYHDKFGSSGSDASDDSDDSSDPEEHVIDGMGTDSESISLPAGRYSVEFTVEHDRALSEVDLIVEDSRGRKETLFSKGDFAEDEQTFRDRTTIEVGNRLGQLDPGRIHFDVEVKAHEDRQSYLVEWEIVVSER